LKWTKEIKVELDYGKNHLWRHDFYLKCLRRKFENDFVKLKRLKIAIYYEEELELERVKDEEKKEKEKEELEKKKRRRNKKEKNKNVSSW